jgi:ketosteroid isomerase-like protein
MEYSMNDTIELRRAVDRILLGDLDPMLDLLAEDVEFCVAVGGDEPICLDDLGKQPVVDYFSALGGLVTFWQMDYTARGDQLIAWGKERFTIENCALEGGCEFALVFDVSQDLITRFLVVEDLRSFILAGNPSANRELVRDWCVRVESNVTDLELVGA